MTPDPTNPVLAVEQAWSKFSPLEVRETRDYAELSFGEHQTQAMTMAPDDWVALDLAIKALAHLSQGWKPDREAVARIIDAEAFDIDLEVFATARWGSATEGRVAVAQIMLAERQKAALVKADAILALPTPAPKDEGWRPIESAPKDGTLIDIWWCGGDMPNTADCRRVLGRWSERREIFGATEPEGWRAGVSVPGPEYTATHWMPLPTAPTQRAGGTEHG